MVADEAELLAVLRASLLDGHLAPMLERSTRGPGRCPHPARLARLGGRHGDPRSADVLPGSSAQNIGALLTALGVDDLIELVRPGRPAS